MPAQPIQFVIPGVRLDVQPETETTGLLKITPISSHLITPAARGAVQPEARVETPADSIVKIEYENGVTEYLRADQFAEETGASRGAAQVRVPLALNRGVSTRGPADWIIKGLHAFGISPADAIAHESADLIVRHFDGRLRTGLFLLNKDGTFGKEIKAAGELDTKAPYLVFIHGTASSTEGSFNGFWRDATNQQTAEWKQLLAIYGERILALEHKTFSVSPAQNTLDLANLLPDNAVLHVITHSRGGLVGELLCLNGLNDADLTAFSGRPDEQLLKDLATLLGKKDFTIRKFVRTACPAAGTILASGRLDLYLNLILNVIGRIPALAVSPTYALFKATALELIKLRTDPNEIPGIEAQMPESPVIHLLNTKGRSSTADLGVIAGDFDGTGFWGSLKEYALRAYYWEDTDFVVNTRSMSGGMERKGGVFQFLDQGDTVNHFSYFKNSRTRTQMLSWLSASPSAPAQEFVRVRGVELRAGARGAASLPICVLVPDIFGTHLDDANGTVWLDFEALGKGRFKDLASPGLKPGKLLPIYDALYHKLLATHDVVLFPYDWRASIATNADRLASVVQEKLGDGLRTVRFAANGAGGLIVREMARNQADLWASLRERDTRLLMLGAPNRGTWHVARMLTGESAFVRMLALLSRASQAEIVGMLQQFRGLLDLLPEEMYEPKRWSGVQLGRPNPDTLAASRDWRKSFADAPFDTRSMFYIAGSAAATPSEMDQYSPDGDGHVTHDLGVPKGIRTWYNRNTSHIDLASQPDAVADVLNTGRTSVLPSMAPATAAITDPARLLRGERAVFFPSETDLIRAAMGGSAKPAVEAENVLCVTVAHGHLREASHPVAVGHYIGDSIVSAEAELDRNLGGKLSNRFHLDLYPGPVGTAEVVAATGSHPPGALIIGLGEVGEITPQKVHKGTLEACLRYALSLSELQSNDGRKPQSAAISTLLIGVSGGRAISVMDSVTAIVRAAIEANRVLNRRNLLKSVRIDEVEFIELFEETAIEAAHAAATLQERLKPDLLGNERIAFDGVLRSLAGGKFRRPVGEYASGWWRRLQVTQTDEKKTAGPSTELAFAALTDRARAEETKSPHQTALIDELLSRSTEQAQYDQASAVALFELLLPNGLKDQTRENANVVLVVDAGAAKYPWELMAERTRQRSQPLAVEMGMIRQFKTDVFRIGPRAAREHNALVIGDTKSELPELRGAQAEATSVARMLEGAGYAADPFIRQNPVEIIQALFAKEYRVIHLAGHGIYNPAEPAKSGMVLSNNVYLTPLELCQIRDLPELVFINCCHLGQFETQRLNLHAPHAFAASVSEALIKMGVKAVIAAGWAVDDSAAVVFAETFYRHMLAGDKFGAAVKAARKAAYGTGSTNTWGAYQCYGNPDFVLHMKDGAKGWAKKQFYSKREYLEELRDITADARGAAAEVIGDLAGRVTELDRAVHAGWRDGEMLAALGAAYQSVTNLGAAIDAFDAAITYPETAAPIEAVEQLANCLDYQAFATVESDKAKADALWNRAEDLVNNLRRDFGNNGPRFNLIAAMNKRRGRLEETTDLYRSAYEHIRKEQGKIDAYSGFNWVTLAYVRNLPIDEALQQVSDDCIAAATEAVNEGDPNFWVRVRVPDAMLAGHLIKGDLAAHLAEMESAYDLAFGHATPNEKKSTCDQLRFIQTKRPSNELEQLIDRLCS